jgi:biopolymer transport protein ExbD
MRIRRTQAQTPPISLVSVIDVMMILLIFFMVTSTYLDLGMIPMADAPDDALSPGEETVQAGAPLLIRLGPDGTARVRGRMQDAEGLTTLLRRHLAGDERRPVLVLPSGNATAQALVGLLDVVTAAGVQNLRILRLEAAP